MQQREREERIEKVVSEWLAHAKPGTPKWRKGYEGTRLHLRAALSSALATTYWSEFSPVRPFHSMPSIGEMRNSERKGWRMAVDPLDCPVPCEYWEEGVILRTLQGAIQQISRWDDRAMVAVFDICMIWRGVEPTDDIDGLWADAIKRGEGPGAWLGLLDLLGDK
jgi:hypothetical protein